MAKIDGLEIVITKQMQKMIDKELKKRFEELKPELAKRYEELLNIRNAEKEENNKLRAELARRDEQIAELTATTHSQAVRNAELLRFVWWVYQVYARNVQELTSGITEACTYETEEKAEKGKHGLPIRCWEYIRHLEEYTAGIYNGTYLDSETSTGVKDPPAGHWKSHVDPKELE